MNESSREVNYVPSGGRIDGQRRRRNDRRLGHERGAMQVSDIGSDSASSMTNKIGYCDFAEAATGREAEVLPDERAPEETVDVFADLGLLYRVFRFQSTVHLPAMILVEVSHDHRILQMLALGRSSYTVCGSHNKGYEGPKWSTYGGSAHMPGVTGVFSPN